MKATPETRGVVVQRADCHKRVAQDAQAGKVAAPACSLRLGSTAEPKVVFDSPQWEIQRKYAESFFNVGPPSYKLI